MGSSVYGLECTFPPRWSIPLLARQSGCHVAATPLANLLCLRAPACEHDESERSSCGCYRLAGR